MAVFTRGNYNCACSREDCDWTCTTYATMMSNLVPNTASQSCKILSKPFKSNADRIRSLSDQELGERLAILTDCVNCPCRDPHDQCDTVDGSCKKQWLNWLKGEGGDAQ